MGRKLNYIHLLFFSTIIVILLMSAGCERKATMVSRANGRSHSIIDGKSDSFVDAKSKMTIELDTIVRDWHMLLQTADNGIKIKNENFYDKTLFVTIVKNGKTLFHQKAVTTPWLLGSPDNERQLYAGPLIAVSNTLYAGPLIAVSNTSVYLFVGSYLPETDDGFTYILAFSKDGNVNKYQMPQSLDESDLVTEFYLLYSHECFYEPFDAESLQQIIKEYCTDELLWKIKQQGKFAIFPPKISDRHSLKFDVASEMIDIDTTKMLSYSRIYFYKRHSYKEYCTDELLWKIKQQGKFAIFPPKISDRYSLKFDVASEMIDIDTTKMLLYSRIYFYKRHSYQPLDSMKVVLKGRRNEYKGVNYDKILSINH